MDDDFVKKRLERDLADLKRMCDDHFKKREEDDSVVTDLEKRIADRQTVSLKYRILLIRVRWSNLTDPMILLLKVTVVNKLVIGLK